ncbi:MAG TPA: ATP-binding protein [Chitinophagaceae bacterium]|nr:ATP-binding protein [Chitinophagaceae bacterium]
MEEVIQINSELAKLREDLEKKNMEVESLNNKLEELTKETNQFTYIVSHDLQASLRLVTGFLDLLGKKHADKLDGSAKQYIDYAVKGACKMRSLVADLLEYSRLNPDTGEFAEVDLDVIMQETKEKYQSLIEETGAVIISDHLPAVKANKKQMAQLFQHLLENALKFRSRAVPEINITLKKENGFWVIGIKDNGIGIDPAFAEKIFIIFRRLYNDEAGYDGTGIGLALCKKITQLHGGEIWVEPAGESGSIFYFSLPVRS